MMCHDTLGTIFSIIYMSAPLFLSTPNLALMHRFSHQIVVWSSAGEFCKDTQLSTRLLVSSNIHELSLLAFLYFLGISACNSVKMNSAFGKSYLDSFCSGDLLLYLRYLSVYLFCEPQITPNTTRCPDSYLDPPNQIFMNVNL